MCSCGHDTYLNACMYTYVRTYLEHQYTTVCSVIFLKNELQQISENSLYMYIYHVYMYMHVSVHLYARTYVL